MEKLNILMLTLDYPPYTYGGIGTHVYNICEELKKMECKITLFVARLGKYFDEQPSEVIDGNLKIIKIGTQYLNCGENIDGIYSMEEMQWAYHNIMLFNYISEYIVKNNTKFNVLHVQHGAKFAFTMAALKRKYGLKTVTTMHAMNSGYDEYVDSIRNYGLINSDAVICVSNYMKEELLQRHQHLPKLLYTIYNGIRYNNYKVKKDFDIVFCGRITKNKGCDYLCESLKLVFNQTIDREINVVIVGEGNYKNEMQERLMNYSNVSFLGNIFNEDVLKIMCRSKICVIPSKIEPFGMVALESMSAKCITIASNQGGLKEIITNKKNGFLFETGDVNALADIILWVLSNYENCSSILINAEQTVNNFNWNSITKDTYTVYKKLVENEI